MNNVNVMYIEIIALLLPEIERHSQEKVHCHADLVVVQFELTYTGPEERVLDQLQDDCQYCSSNT